MAEAYCIGCDKALRKEGSMIYVGWGMCPDCKESKNSDAVKRHLKFDSDVRREIIKRCVSS